MSCDDPGMGLAYGLTADGDPEVLGPEKPGKTGLE